MILDEKIIEIELSKQKKISEEVHDEMSHLLGGSKPEAYKHIITFLNIYYDNKIFSKDELKKIITDGTFDGQIDAIHIINGKVDIFDIKKSSGFDFVKINHFLESVEKRIFKGQKYSTKLFPAIKKRISQIKKIKGKKINMIVIRKGFSDVPNTKYYESKFKTYTSFGEIIFLNSNNLVSLLINKIEYYPTWTIPINNKEAIIPKNSGLKEETVIKLPVKEIIKQYEKGKNNGLDFFYKNVRNYKKNKKLSDNFKESISKYPKKFHLLHNGITVLTDSLIEHDHGKIIIKNPQIVNGLQTILSLYQIYLKNSEILNGVKIFCKIVKADKNMANAVCESSNTQLPVYIWELRAHDEIQFKLEKIINNISTRNYFFARKDKTTNPKGSRKIYLPLFIQWVHAAIFKKPWEVKDRKKLLFDITDYYSTYNIIKRKLLTINVKKIERLCEFAFFVNERIKKAPKKKKGFLRDINFHLIAGLYNNNKSKPQVKDYNYMVNVLEKFAKDKKGKNSALTNNKIFKQSDESWIYLEKKLKIK